MLQFNLETNPERKARIGGCTLLIIEIEGHTEQQDALNPLVVSFRCCRHVLDAQYFGTIYGNKLYLDCIHDKSKGGILYVDITTLYVDMLTGLQHK